MQDNDWRKGLQVSDEELDDLFERMKAAREPKQSKIGLWLWLFPAACLVMLIVVWWRLFL
jgi:cytochrome c-type biogenesis protein CcmH/NrfF